MTGIFVQLIIRINAAANAFGKAVLGFIESLAGWQSNTIISVAAGALFVLAFKYTSDQKAIGRAKDKFKANMLAMKLFKDELGVILRSAGGALGRVFQRFFYSLRPLLVMIVPVALLLVQMSLWYEARPLRVGEEAMVTMELAGDPNDGWPEVSLLPNEKTDVTMGPVKIFANNEMMWKVQGVSQGRAELMFAVNDEQVGKELVVGEGLKRISVKRPGGHFWQILEHPAERPFGNDSIVQSISISYPKRVSWTSGSFWWICYFFGVSVAAGLIFLPVFKVKI